MSFLIRNIGFLAIAAAIILQTAMFEDLHSQASSCQATNEKISVLASSIPKKILAKPVSTVDTKNVLVWLDKRDLKAGAK